MFDNPTDNHTDIEVPLYDKLRFHEAKNHGIVTKITRYISLTGIFSIGKDTPDPFKRRVYNLISKKILTRFQQHFIDT